MQLNWHLHTTWRSGFFLSNQTFWIFFVLIQILKNILKMKIFFYISNKYNKINSFTNRSTTWFKLKLDTYEKILQFTLIKLKMRSFFSIKSERLMFCMNNKMDLKTKILHTSFNVFFWFWIWFRFHHQLSHLYSRILCSSKYRRLMYLGKLFFRFKNAISQFTFTP